VGASNGSTGHASHTAAPAESAPSARDDRLARAKVRLPGPAALFRHQLTPDAPGPGEIHSFPSPSAPSPARCVIRRPSRRRRPGTSAAVERGAATSTANSAARRGSAAARPACQPRRTDRSASRPRCRRGLSECVRPDNTPPVANDPVAACPSRAGGLTRRRRRYRCWQHKPIRRRSRCLRHPGRRKPPA
jgi:hypothetical protein